MDKTIDDLTAVLMIKFGYKAEFEPVVRQAVKTSVNKVLDYTNQTKLIGSMEDYAYEIAVIALNRDGDEGDSSRSEGGVSRSFVEGFPDDIKTALNKYRVGRVRRLMS